MSSNRHRRPPTAISTIDIDVDDIGISPEEDYRPPYRYEETVSSESDNKKARWCSITVILIIIIVSLLSITAVIIAIYTLVSLANNRATTTISTVTISTTTNATTAALVCSSSPTTSYQYSTSAPSQCSNYTNNSDATRSASYTQSINGCDNVAPFSNKTSVWIRFVDPAGTILTTTPIPPNSCGTVATGWYAGVYPAALYTTATSIACFYYSTNTCADCSSVSVTNCGTYTVYLLPAPDNCNYRYCTI